MLDVRRLRLLHELSHRGTIAAVAEALAYTPSAVSQQLAALEREAGVALLHRTGRRVTLTPAARMLVEHTEAVLERLERAAADLVAARDGLAGPLRIGAFPSAARAILPNALAALVTAHPLLEPRVREIDPAAVAGSLRTGEVDVALVHEYDFVIDPAEPGLDTVPLFDEPMHLAAPRVLAPVRDEGHHLRRWCDAPWIVASPNTRCGMMTVRACEAAGFTPRVRHVVDDFATVLALVAIGDGVALVPQLGISDPGPHVTLAPLPMRRHTLAATRRGASARPAIREFTDAMCREGAAWTARLRSPTTPSSAPV